LHVTGSSFLVLQIYDEFCRLQRGENAKKRGILDKLIIKRRLSIEDKFKEIDFQHTKNPLNQGDFCFNYNLFYFLTKSSLKYVYMNEIKLKNYEIIHKLLKKFKNIK